MEDEQLEVSKEYKKAYNQADMILTYMPHILKGVQMPEKDITDYDKGFSARIREYEKEQEAIRNFSVEKMKREIRQEREQQNKDINKGKDRSK